MLHPYLPEPVKYVVAYNYSVVTQSYLVILLMIVMGTKIHDYPHEGTGDGLYALDHNADVDHNDNEFDDGLYEVDDAVGVHDNADLDDVDDPDFRKSVVSINDNFDDSDDVGMEEYTSDDDQFSNYEINSDNVGEEEYTMMINSVIMISIVINTISMITVKWL